MDIFNWYYIANNYPMIYAMINWICAYWMHVWFGGTALSLAYVAGSCGLTMRRALVCIGWLPCGLYLASKCTLQMFSKDKPMLSSSSNAQKLLGKGK